MSPLDLLGSWSLERTIEDRAAGQRLTVDGTLVLSADGPDAVDWHEAGTLQAPERAPVEVTRTLRVVRRGADTDGPAWWVLFDHGGDFHPWAPGEPVVHPCGADTYRGRITGSAAGWQTEWQVVWEVTGPAKDYTMTTRLRR